MTINQLMFIIVIKTLVKKSLHKIWRVNKKKNIKYLKQKTCLKIIKKL